MLKFLNLDQIKTTIARFPVAVLLTLVLSALFYCLVHGSYEQETVLGHGIFATVLTFFLSVGVGLKWEETAIKKSTKLIFQVLSLVIGGLFFLRFTRSGEEQSAQLFALLLACVLGICFIAPFVVKRKKAENADINTPYSQYFLKFATVILFGFILWAVSLGLGALAIGAVDMLFDVEVGNSYAHRAIFALSLFTPLVCLTKIPQKNPEADPQFSVNGFASFVIKYVLLPFIGIYFVILYVYSGNVLIHLSERPQGEVSRLVIAFSIFGYLTYLLSYFFKEIGIVKRIRKVFPFVVIPQLFMLFYAIYLRIAQYDLTTNRYLVVIFGVWLLVISLYFIVSKKKALLFIPASLAVFSAVFSFWQWGVFTLPMERQLERLEHNLEKAEILVNGEIKPLEGEIDVDLENEIYDGMRYICDYDCKKLNTALWVELVNEERVTFYDLREYLNLSYSYWYNRWNQEIDRFYIRAVEDIFPLETAGYDFVVEAREENGFLIVGDGVREEKFDLSAVKAEILSKVDKKNADVHLTKEDVMFYLTGDAFEVKLMVRNWSLDANDSVDSWGLQGYVLVKRQRK